MHRRSLLALLGGGLSALAGCGERAGSAAGTATGDAAPPTPAATTVEGSARRAAGEAFVTDAGWSVTVSSSGVRVAVPAVTGDGVDVVGFEGSQFVVVTIEVDAPADNPAPVPRADQLPFGLLIDGSPTGNGPYRVLGSEGRRISIQAFRAPIASAESAAVRLAGGGSGIGWPRVTWILGRPTVAALAAAPRFEIRSFSVPETAPRGEPVAVDVTVANTGEREGTFLARLAAGTASKLLAIPVETGETVERSIDVAPPAGAPADLAVTLDWGLGRRRRDVSLAG